MPERNIGLEILEGIREIKAYKAGEINLKTRQSVPSTNNEPSFDLWLQGWSMSKQVGKRWASGGQAVRRSGVAWKMWYVR